MNVAARFATYAGPREVVVSEEARQAADVPGVAFELIGDVLRKGVAKPVRLQRALTA